MEDNYCEKIYHNLQLEDCIRPELPVIEERAMPCQEQKLFLFLKLIIILIQVHQLVKDHML